MRSCPSFRDPRRQHTRRSAVLILTLAIVVILTILLLGFVTVVTRDRGASQSYGQSLQAEQIGLGGLDQVVAQLQAEITDTSLSVTNGTSPYVLYVPIANTNAVPQRMLALPANLATITKVSTNGVPLFQGTSASSGQNSTNLASPSLTTSLSLNGRSIGISRWNKPILTTSANNFPTPCWVIVTRNGPQVFNTYTPQLAANSQANGSYALGRYAYVVYDTSGLIDINVAGFPSGASASTAAKGSLPWADLTQLTNTAAPVISQTPDIDNLVGWRNAANYSTYASYVTNTWATNGFMVVAPGDTTFLSRQDLIQYAQTQNTDLTNALPFLTTFSRELAGPTWAPSMTTPNYAADTYAPGYNYTNNQYLPTTTGGTNDNVFILEPRVQTAFARANGTQAVVGEPLVKYRFPLEKLALLESVGTTYSVSDWNNNKDNIQTQIQQYFGLDLASDANPPSYRHWIYPTTSTTYPHVTGRILTLDEVAALNPGREPDFFELLQAGILQGSVGYNYQSTSPYYHGPSVPDVRADYYLANNTTYWTATDADTKITYHILRIGANIIDQWGSESFPTTITFNAGSGVTENVYGIKDLPYINKLFVKAYSSASLVNPTTNNYTSYTNYPYLYCELWNPHQAPAHIVAGNYPTSIQISPEPHTSANSPADWYGLAYQGLGSYAPDFFYWNGTNWTANGANINYFSDLPNNGNLAFTYSPTSSANSYREPSVITNGSSATAPVWSSATNLAAWELPPMPLPSLSTLASGSTNTDFGALLGTQKWSVLVASSTILRLQYLDAGSVWRTYSTFVGLDETNNFGNTGNAPKSSGWYLQANSFGPNDQGDTNASFTTTVVYPKIDPRTSRYGSSIYESTAKSGPLPNVSLTPAANNAYIENTAAPFPVTGQGNDRVDLWAVNDPVVTNALWTPNYYQNSDTAYRPGDARYTTNYSGGTVTCPLYYTGNTVDRPIMLNRPFQSVGELGYAFRDEPWKTLNLFGTNSADSALLDLFTLNNSPTLAAGKVNPNTPYPQVLAALISGAATNSSSASISPATAWSLARAITNTTATAPFMNRASLVNGFMTNPAVISAFPAGIKPQREAIIRALADSANTRTWNFMIDIVAQVGQYPDTAKSLDDFVVNGERRYWLHIAIDRFTGQVVDKQLEIVNE